jgi:hypothetical protein
LWRRENPECPYADAKGRDLQRLLNGAAVAQFVLRPSTECRRAIMHTRRHREPILGQSMEHLEQ